MLTVRVNKPLRNNDIMTLPNKIVFLLFVTSCFGNEDSSIEETEKEQLDSAESKDKLEIVKRIKKVNDDGSYTIGYEADDGSFKIESRDVLGNIKGTYGFVDDEGQVKRVSYSTSNTSEVTHKPETSVVQRIPQKQSTTKDKSSSRIIGSSTKRPTTVSTTPAPSTATTSSSNVIQSIARRRVNSASSTTIRPNYKDVVTLNTKTTSKPNAVIYTSAAPRVLLQRPSTTSTAASNAQLVKTEGQLARPDKATEQSTPLPVFRHYSLKRFEDKPVTEAPEGNILRRQLSQEKQSIDFDPQEQVYGLGQSIGDDHPDVYNSGNTVTQRPLFTTTQRSRVVPIISSTTSTPVAVPRPAVHYQRLQDAETNNREYSQETVGTTDTPTIQTVVQIPPNGRLEGIPAEPLVAIRHPFQKGAILVPLSQLQGRIIPIENMRDVQEARRQYYEEARTTTAPPVVEIEQQKLKKIVPAVRMRPIPVQVDENGYIRELPQPAVAYPVPVPVPVAVHQPKYAENESENDIDKIEPPVSTKEFQMLLEQLIARQKRLEKIAAITNRKEMYQQQQPTRYRAAYQPSPIPYVFPQRTGPVQFESQQRQQSQPRYLLPQDRHQQQIVLRPRQQQYDYQQEESAIPTRRVARLLPHSRQKLEEDGKEQYLPVEVREMLLLRMLQLAMNPALPLDNDDVEEAINSANSPSPQYRRSPMRNVEILGEEDENEEDRPRRSLRRGARLKEEDMEYLE